MYTKDKINSINIRIDSQLKKDINTYSKRMGMSNSKFIRFILASYIISLKGVLENDNKKMYINNIL